MGKLLKLVIRLLVIACALLVITQVVPGIRIVDFPTAVLVAIVWGILSLFIKPLLQLIALPITILTLGLFAFVVNALLFWLVAALVPGFAVSGFLPALLGSLILAIIMWVLHKVF